MTDLNKTISNLPGVVDLFSSTVDAEILTNSVEKSPKDVQDTLPATELQELNAFISLLTHVVTKKTSSRQETEQNLTQILEENQQINSETIQPTIELEQEALEKKSEEQTPDEMENNVAVFWISSQYYQQEIKINPKNTEQESNSNDKFNKSAQVNETFVQFTETIENSLVWDKQQTEQQPETHDKNNVLQDSMLILNSDSEQTIKNTLANPVEITESPSCRTIDIESKKLFLPADPKFSYWENKEGEKETSQTPLFQSLPVGIEKQKENASTLPEPPALIENTEGIKLLSMNNIPHEVPGNVPMENRTHTFETIPKTLIIPIEIDKPEWSKQFSEHIIWLGTHEVKSAIIKINPEDLGPLEISIKVINDSASVNITTHNHQIRDIIDQSLPKLQAMMAEQGLNLSDVQIDSNGNPRQDLQQNNGPQEELTHVLEDEIGITPLKNKKILKGLVDFFA